VSRRNTPAARRTFKPTLEALEHRWVPSTLTVTSIADSGAGSLRAEIAAAHKGDTIAFDSSLNGKTITLTSGELLISKNLIIAGPIDRNLTISGSNASRVFDVLNGVTGTLSGLTISNGQPGSGYGGGILNYGTLTVSNGILSGNSASNYGGGIYNTGTLTVTGSILSNNSAGIGGGISAGGGQGDRQRQQSARKLRRQRRRHLYPKSQFHTGSQWGQHHLRQHRLRKRWRNRGL
jgi:hypothetical protein